jgi:lysylphosphatidylglycerol synthetase-like protein (DUF2156 family)
LAQAFQHYCKEEGWRVAYITVSEGFAKWAIQHVSGSLMAVAEELVVDPHVDRKTGTKERNLRNKVKIAQRAGVTVHEYLGNEPALENAIEEVGNAWLKGRKGAQLYLAQVQLFAERLGKRWFYARHGEGIVGVALLNQLSARNGWLMQLLLISPDAPNGTSEQLVTATLQALRSEGCRFLSFGAAQSEELGEMIGIHPVIQWLARMGFQAMKRIYHLDRRRDYWKKYQPQSEGSYILFSEKRVGLREGLSVIRALNGGI